MTSETSRPVRHATKVMSFLAAFFLFAGCHSTTVSVVAEDPDAPPELTVEIAGHHAGEVEIKNTTDNDWFFPFTQHNKTTIHVPPGSKIVVMPASGPMIRRCWEMGPTTTPATEPDALE